MSRRAATIRCVAKLTVLVGDHTGQRLRILGAELDRIFRPGAQAHLHADPVFTGGIPLPTAMAIAAAAFVLLAAWRTPAWAVVLAAGAAGYLVL